MKKITLAIATLLGLSSMAFADNMGQNGDKFYEEAAHFENACKQMTCAAPYSKVVLLSATGVNKLDKLAMTRLSEIALDQAQIWGDTILEGDYYADGQTQLDGVTAIYKNNDLIGYKIAYSEKAWYTGQCEFNGHAETLVSCQEGRIHEETYVSGDTQTYFGDEDKRAQFSFLGK